MTREPNLLPCARVGNAKSLRWQKAAACMNCDRSYRGSISEVKKKLCFVCSTKHDPFTQSVPFSRAVVGLAISVVSDPQAWFTTRDTFVAGLELIYWDMPNTVLCYRLPGNQIMIDL